MTDRLDSVSKRVLARAFESVCLEMGSAMIRTAVSAVFVEARDFSCALLDTRAELVAAANFDPSHLSAMALTAEYAFMELGWEDLRQGDVIVVNDPYRGGGHLTDICVIRPIFVEGELLGFAINRGHHIDVGGMAVAGFPGTARSVFHEGIRIPPVKWFEAGAERRQVMDLILLNVRFPRQQLGDFRGQLASCITAERRMKELVDRYGVETVKDAMTASKNHSEELMRKSIKTIPDGVYWFEDVMDDDRVGNGPYLIKVEIRIDGSDATVNFRGTSSQAEGPINSSYGNTVGSVFNAFLHTFGADIDFNHGCFRPVHFEVPRGSLLNPVPPAPVFGGVTETSIRIIDGVCGALARAVPDQVAAGSYGTCINVAGGGWDDARSQPFGFYFFQEGGWGATDWRDGWTSVPNPTSNFNDFPVEVVESDLPLMCHEVALSERSAGAGEHRGGFGTRRTYEVVASTCELSALAERFVVPPYGLEQGLEAQANSLLVRRRGEPSFKTFTESFDTASPSKFASLVLKRGDCFAMVTGGGGGYGNPFNRDPRAVLDDVTEGLISPADARITYGVELIERGEWRIDEQATAVLRGGQHPSEPRPRQWGPTVGPSVRKGYEADEIVAAERLGRAVFSRIGTNPCKTACPKQADPVRCPFHHPFALKFWDAFSLRRWATANCLIVQTGLPNEDEGRSK